MTDICTCPNPRLVKFGDATACELCGKWHDPEQGSNQPPQNMDQLILAAQLVQRAIEDKQAPLEEIVAAWEHNNKRPRPRLSKEECVALAEKVHYKVDTLFQVFGDGWGGDVLELSRRCRRKTDQGFRTAVVKYYPHKGMNRRQRRRARKQADKEAKRKARELERKERRRAADASPDITASQDDGPNLGSPPLNQGAADGD